MATFVGHRLPSQTNTCLFCTFCPHSCAPGKNFPVGHPSQIAPGQARLTLEFFGHRLTEKKLQLVDMNILLILLSLGLGCYTLTPLREIDAPVDQPQARNVPSWPRPCVQCQRMCHAVWPLRIHTSHAQLRHTRPWNRESRLWYHFVTSRLPPGRARLHLIAFIGHRLCPPVDQP